MRRRRVVRQWWHQSMIDLFLLTSSQELGQAYQIFRRMRRPTWLSGENNTPPLLSPTNEEGKRTKSQRLRIVVHCILICLPFQSVYVSCLFLIIGCRRVSRNIAAIHLTSHPTEPPSSRYCCVERQSLGYSIAECAFDVLTS